MRAKKYLMQYKRCRMRIVRLNEQIQELEDQVNGLSSPQMDQDRVQSSHDPDRIGKVIARISDLKDKWYDEKLAAVDIMDEIIDTINALEDVDYQRLLQLRYIARYRPYDKHYDIMPADERAARLTPWEVIAEEMHYSPRWILTLHGRALREVEKLIGQEES